MKTLLRMLRTPPADLLLLAETLVLLTAARIALRVVPMGKIAKWLQQPARNAPSPRTDGKTENRIDKKICETISRVQWAIAAIARRAPGRFLCFPQALAAYALLRRRRIDGVLSYGVNRGPANELRAHTWLTVGDRVVVGGEASSDFTVIHTFP